MGEHFFGLGRGKVSERKAKAVERIVRRHGATFTRYVGPGDPEPRFWFACENRGEPFDSQAEREVLDAVAAAGIVLP